MQIQFFLPLVAFLCAAVTPVALHAQAFPSQPIQLIVPWPPGGGSDTAMRMTADAASKRMGVPVVVVNRPGAGGTVGIKEAMSAKPDGYTLAMIATGAIFAQYNNPNANSLDEMEPIVFFGDDPSAKPLPLRPVDGRQFRQPLDAMRNHEVGQVGLQVSH